MSEVFYSNCAANGCPCAGVMTSSTRGEGQYYCAHHFGAEPGLEYQITTDLQRMAWLVQLCKGVRYYLNTGIWTEAAASGYKEIPLRQRSDLYQRASFPARGDKPGAPAESYAQWLARLESELYAITRGKRQPDLQATP